eukprot:5479793-Amphidinium_carterae.1
MAQTQRPRIAHTTRKDSPKASPQRQHGGVERLPCPVRIVDMMGQPALLLWWLWHYIRAIPPQQSFRPSTVRRPCIQRINALSSKLSCVATLGVCSTQRGVQSPEVGAGSQEVARCIRQPWCMKVSNVGTLSYTHTHTHTLQRVMNCVGGLKFGGSLPFVGTCATLRQGAFAAARSRAPHLGGTFAM